jgi:thymidine kinase
MFIEPNIRNTPHNNAGWIEVVCGSMFSGKTEELIRRVKRAKIAKQKVAIFKPAIDTRFHARHVVSHNANAVMSTPVSSSKEILKSVEGCDVVGIDEAQFFDEGIIEVSIQLANQGIRVIAAGLDMDFQGKPFGPMPHLMAVAEYVTKVHAICVSCGAVANYSHRLVSSDEKVVLGEQDIYEPLCRKCYYSDEKPEAKVEITNAENVNGVHKS